MFFSAVASIFKRFWPAGLMVVFVACFSFYFRLGDVFLMSVLAIAAVSLLAFLLFGIPVEYSKRKK